MEIIPVCRRYGLEVVTFNPLCGGLLTGRYSRNLAEAESNTEPGRYATDTFLGPIFRKMFFNENNFQAIDVIHTVAEKHGLFHGRGSPSLGRPSLSSEDRK